MMCHHEQKNKTTSTKQQVKKIPLKTLMDVQWKIRPKYKFLQELGNGSYGTVCQAKVRDTAQQVAIKQFADVFRDDETCRHIVREIELLSCLQHPCITKALDLLLCPGSSEVYVVMELAETDLRKLSRSPVFLNGKQVRLLMYRLLTALNYLHSGSIVHRDIKPGNILINSDCSLRLCDFSLSRSTATLQARLYDCDHALRHNPLLNQSSSFLSLSSSLQIQPAANTPVPDEAAFDNALEEGVQAQGTVHCSFLVNHKKGSSAGSDAASVSTGAPPTPASVTPPKPRSEEMKSQLPPKRPTHKEERQKERARLMAESKSVGEGYSRELSCHVTTRWYRAPEIILLEKIYTTAVDIWAAGCVFGEMLQLMQENEPDITKRKPLFQGDSCFPLSPTRKPSIVIARMPLSQEDQLSVIMDVLGSPSPADLDFIIDAKARTYASSFEGRSRVPFRDIYPNAEPDALDLLEKMLTFNPYHRITAKEALRHRYFASVRDKPMEAECPSPLVLHTDDPTQPNLQVVLQQLLSRVKLSSCSKSKA